MSVKDLIAARDAEVKILLKKRRNAVNNRSKQKRREDAGDVPRVSSSFWEQVVRDYNRQIYGLDSSVYLRLKV